MQIFVDAIDLREIEEALKTGLVSGVVIDPELILQSTDIDSNVDVVQLLNLLHIQILDVIQKYKPDAHFSVEVFSQRPDKTLEQAKWIRKSLKHKNLSVKISVGFRELGIISELKKNKISVNCTACMTINQGILAALAGAEFVSFFWDYIRYSYAAEEVEAEEEEIDASSEDSQKNKYIFEKELERARGKGLLDAFDTNPEKVIAATHHLFNLHKLPTKIIACSIKCPVDARDAFLAGADIVAMPFEIFKEMPDHFMTEKIIDQSRPRPKKRKSDD